MINYFKKLLTGYKTVKRNVNGRDYKYSYSGKPLYFDPLAMLREFQFRTAQVSVQRLSLNFPISEPISELPFPKESDLPSVICECTINEKEFKVTRFSLKDGIQSVSFYRFELNGEQIGTFRRKYDYGSQIQKIGLNLASICQSTIHLEKEKWLWESKSGAQIFVEKFGHSQIWFFPDLNLLDF